MSLHKKIKFKKFTDGRGNLIPIEIGSVNEKFDIPFDVKRCYVISNPTNNGVRGRHAHKDLEQVIICLHGSFTLVLENGRGGKEEIILDKDNIGIHIKNLVWRELKNFSENCVILVLASQHYNEADYVRDYNDFLSLTAND